MTDSRKARHKARTQDNFTTPREAVEQLERLRAEHARYWIALDRIANNEPGVWGQIANEALRGGSLTPN